MPSNFSLEENREFGSKNRINVFRAIVIIFTIVFIIRLGYIQIVKGSVYRLESETQAIKQVIVEPFRGIMYDRNGEILVHNEPSFTVTFTLNDFQWESLPLLSSILKIDTNDIKSALDPYLGASKFVPIKIFKDMDYQRVALLEEYGDMLPGVDVVVESKRLYDFNCNMAHMLGYNREITKKQLEDKEYYRPGDAIGQTGLEYSYEELLRGNKGIQFVAVNKFGQKVASFDNGKSDISSSNGFDLILTLDKKLQEQAERLLKGRRGALVAIDPNNGEILAIASKPDFDLRDFSGKIPSDLYSKLINDPASPMYNRATMARYAPGSTWKMLMALAGLSEGIISENTTILCEGSITLGFKPFKCHGAHGNISVRNAIKVSCNVFFYKLAMMLGEEIIEKYGRMFGFGDKTYIDLPSEKNGFLPSAEWIHKKFKTQAPKGYLANWGIGQGEISVTPLQMAMYAATLANKGTVYQPHIVRFVHNNLTDKIEPIAYDSKELPINKKYFDIIQKGMYDVVNSGGGTAPNAKVPGITVCGKTGTAQNPHGRDHSWFICFAPMDNPKIAIACIVENAGWGAEIAAPIASRLMCYYFYPDYDRRFGAPEGEAPADSLQTEETIDATALDSER